MESNPKMDPEMGISSIMSEFEPFLLLKQDSKSETGA